MRVTAGLLNLADRSDNPAFRDMIFPLFLKMIQKKT